jgi:hypothetical protein
MKGQRGSRHLLHIPKGCLTETLHLRLHAPQFYPGRISDPALFGPVAF